MTARFDAEVTRTSVCGVPLAAVSPIEAVSLILQAARSRAPYQVHLCNAFTLSLVDQDPRLKAALSHADLNLPDGAPVAWLLRRLGTDGPTRGPELLRGVVERGIDQGAKHLFWGGGTGIAQDMVARLGEDYPGAQIAAAVTPPYRDPTEADLHDVAERARVDAVDIIWVGLGTPKQDYVVARLAELAGCPVVPVGAAFDFVAGVVKEAPPALRGSGLEWVYRLAMEPRRLWRRYLFGNTRFVRSYLRHRRDT